MKGCNAVVRMLTVGVLMAMAGPVAAQQAYPNKPIRLVSPFPPAGSTDILARLVGQKLTESWGQPVLIENHPGANGVIGTDIVAKSSPDGHTILLVNSSHIINALLVTKLPFDPVKDFAPVATLTISQFLMAINPSVPANTLREFIALAKSRPGQLNFASSGNGAVSHLAGELFDLMTGVKMQHIPYKGAAPALTDLVGGQVQVYFATTVSTMPYVKSGKVKALGISGDTRLSILPELPTFSEAGLPDFDVKNWFGIMAPAGTPKTTIGKLSTEIARIMALPDIKEKLASQGLDPLISTPEQFAALMKAEMARYAKVIKTANIKLEN